MTMYSFNKNVFLLCSSKDTRCYILAQKKLIVCICVCECVYACMHIHVARWREYRQTRQQLYALFGISTGYQHQFFFFGGTGNPTLRKLFREEFSKIVMTSETRRMNAIQARERKCEWGAVTGNGVLRSGSIIVGPKAKESIVCSGTFSFIKHLFSMGFILNYYKSSWNN